MARNKVDFCMFCGEAPCICNAPAKAPPKKREPKLAVVEQVESEQIDSELPQPSQKPSFKDAMKNAASQAPPPPVVTLKPVRVVRHVAVDENEALFAAAVRALGDMLGLEDREKYRAILTSSPTAEERKVVWKARRRDGLE